MKPALLILLVCLSVVSANNNNNDLLNRLRIAFGLPIPESSDTRSLKQLRTDLGQVVRDNTNFAIDMYKIINDNEGNLIFSPHAISAVMGMAFAGSKGETKSQIKKTMYFENPNIHGVFRKLISRWLQKTRGVNIQIANSVWVAQKHTLNKEYVDLVRKNYQGEVKLVDFKQNTEAAKNAINGWTATKTKNMIKNIMPDRVLTTNTDMILVNGVFFTGLWGTQFKSIGKKSFNLWNHTTTSAEFMSATKRVPHFVGSNFKSISIPFIDQKSVMTIILPDKGKFYRVKRHLNTSTLFSLFNNRRETFSEVIIPKFKIETELNLRSEFWGLGMITPFVFSTDFSGISSNGSFHINNVIHKTVIEIDDKGIDTETPQTYQPQQKFIADRPFMYVIHDTSGSVLLMGQVVSP